MAETGVALAVYETHTAAEDAIKALGRAGHDMAKLSIVGKGYHTDEHVVGYYNTGDRMLHWGKLGAFWGAIWGLLVGSAFFMVPGIGPVLAAGPLVSAIVGALEGAAVVGGVSALGAGLLSIGIPEDSVLKYETALKADNFLVVVHGTPDDIEKAKLVLHHTSPVETAVHQLAEQ